MGRSAQRVHLDCRARDRRVRRNRVRRRLFEAGATIASRPVTALQASGTVRRCPRCRHHAHRNGRLHAAPDLQHAAHLPVLQIAHPGSRVVVRATHRFGTRGLVECRQSDRRAGRARDQHLRDCGGRLYGPGVCDRPSHPRGIFVARSFSTIGRADDFLRVPGRCQPRIPLVQLVPGRDLHGRRRIARARRSAGDGGDFDQAGNSAPYRRRRLRARGGLSDSPGWVVQAHRKTNLQNGAVAPPLRADRLERAESDRAVRYRRDYLRALQPHDLETEMNFSVQGQKVTVVGAARSGIAAALLLAERGARVTLTDSGADLEQIATNHLREAGVELALGGHRGDTFTSADLLVLSPGVPLDEPSIAAARDAGVRIMGEIEMASRWLSGRIVAITGTKGKSTTTTLTGRMFTAGGLKAVVGGNIGTPLSSQVAASTPDTFHIVEVSSFQLETTNTFHPWIAVLLNLSSDHLDRHTSFEAYRSAKARIFRNQTDDDWAVVNADDPAALELARGARSRRFDFALEAPLSEGVTLSGEHIVQRTAGATTPLVPVR